MPPKRRGAAAKGAGGKRAKKAVAEPEPSTSNPIKDALAKEKAGSAKKSGKVDSLCTLYGASVVEDYDCMLNQTNIGHNNNKYYVIQIVQSSGKFYTWNRWGRVGENGQNSLKACSGRDAAVKDFEKKFKDKTRNNWANRATFVPMTGKYTLIEVEDASEEAKAEASEKLAQLDDDEDVVEKKTAPCTLDKSTQALMKLIFDNDMFKEAMANFEIDVKKMPLGKLSKTQIAKGFDVLVDLENSLKAKKGAAEMTRLTSQFFTLIPHAFGRQRPPVINTLEMIRQKKDMLLVLADIEAAQAMQKDKPKVKKSTKKVVEEVPHELDTKYELLNCEMDPLDKKSNDFKVIKTYLDQTCGGRKLEILDVWEIDREGEAERFAEHDNLENRKLLWHGTNVAVVAAILKSGLRIMPHSGGRVGKGIYFASENAKSAAYVRCSKNTGIMLLSEVALGKENLITRDDSSLTKAPKGTDCVVAKGRTEPDEKFDTTIELDGKTVVVPQGKPIDTKYTGSSFWQSEYLIYKESQNKLRYLLKLKF